MDRSEGAGVAVATEPALFISKKKGAEMIKDWVARVWLAVLFIGVLGVFIACCVVTPMVAVVFGAVIGILGVFCLTFWAMDRLKI